LLSRLTRQKTAIAAAALIALVAGHAQAQTATPPKLSVSQITVALPLVINIPRAGYDAAVKLDAFKQEGLTVKVAGFRDYGEIVQAILADPNTFGWGSSSLIRAVQGQNAPAREIAMASAFFPYQFWVKGDSPINKLTDMKGKRFLTARPGDLIDVVWIESLTAAGIGLNEVTRIEGFDSFGTLMTNTADAVNMDAGAMGRIRKAGFKQIFDYNTFRKEQGHDPNAGVNLGWGTSQKLIDEHPDTVKAFLRALVKGTVKLREDKAFGVAVLQADPYGMDAESAAEVYDELRTKWIVRMDPSRGDYDWDIEKLVVGTMGIPKDKVDKSRFIDTKLIGEVLKEMNVSF
jgi:ABC-type nitrate/sulfonate/bicarbonate transport system substrate-binding protein